MSNNKTYPNFFDSIEKITLEDDLSKFLGAFSNGLIEYSFLDVVKFAGHSCPTVAGAFLMISEGLKALYKEEIPKRGEIEVSFKEDESEGVTGVIANIVTYITGATSKNGFKGINGKFNRTNLLYFNEQTNSNIRFKKVGDSKIVDVYYDLSKLQQNPRIKELMGKIQSNEATIENKKSFAKLWQENVQKIFENKDLLISIKTYELN